MRTHRKPTALAQRVEEPETQGPLEGSEAQVGRVLEESEDGVGWEMFWKGGT